MFTVKAQTSLRILRRSRKFCQRGSDFDNVFFSVDEGRDDPNTTISGPTSDRQRNACRTYDDSTLNAGLVTL